MTYYIAGNAVRVTKESSDKRFHSESDVWYRLRNLMRADGRDMVKRRPDKDGHLTSAPFYLRERKGRYAIHDGQYAIRDLAGDLNREGSVLLTFVA